MGRMGKSRNKRRTFSTGDSASLDCGDKERNTPAAPEKPRIIANMRERDRTQSVNSAFSSLRDLIPTEPLDRKLSKIETLRLATSYIQHLAVQLNADDSQVGAPCNIITSLTFTGLERRKRTICTFSVSNIKRTRTECLNPGPLIYLEEMAGSESSRPSQDQSDQTYKARLPTTTTTGGNFYYHNHHHHQ